MNIKICTTSYLKLLKNVIEKRRERQLKTLNDTKKEIKKIDKELERRQEFMGGYDHGCNHRA